ncbi:MAG: NAD(P)/FAD-dependent oxidoreductase [Candidatus Omnitrophica bacterium]|jgi:phytoene dehydrogenase-like protein|nr:NAD(P)/FAD-dependent oxidoreductase [Candidatus Omnitrophota bacterium]
MNEKYDVVIIGAGIGGLVCGCYLAKAGLKVMIVEQHDKPGGYCTSFQRKGYTFDAGGHYLGGIRNGMLGKVLTEIGVMDVMKFNQFNPVDTIIFPDSSVHIYADIEDTIMDMQKVFPKEKNNITNFFKFILDKDFLSIYKKIKRLSFQLVLDEYFEDNRLKAKFEVLLGGLGLPSDKVSAVSATLLFRETVCDPGWYPKKGLQSFPDLLSDIIRSNGGKIIFGKKVAKILCENNEAKGVVLNDGVKFLSNAVISNADAIQTFTKLIDLESKEKQLGIDYIISPSAFFVYLGLKDGVEKIIKSPSNMLIFSDYDLKKYYCNFDHFAIDNELIKYVVCIFSSLHSGDNKIKRAMELFTIVPFKSDDFWKRHRVSFMDGMLDFTIRNIAGLRDYIDIKFNATPSTFHKYTLNSDGAAYGWASTPNLITKPIFMSRSSIRKLYLAGHWCNGGLCQGGVPQVAVMGRTTARSVIEDAGLKWQYKYNLLI